MPISRRLFLHRSVVLGLVPVGAQVAACSDDGAASADDAGGPIDTGGDAGMDADTGEVDAVELPDLPEYEYAGPLGPEDIFQHGVASGDPLSDAVIIWTRCSTPDDAAVDVWWELSLDAEFTQRVQVGTFVTDTDVDFTVKHDATELLAGQTYYYRFFALGQESPTGRTRTAPTGDVSRLRFGVCSCASYGHGYFTAYRRMAERSDLDCIIHLGDYIYEYGTGQYGQLRAYEPAHEILTLDDYRTRYAYYRLDSDLAEVHRQHPFVHTWDDHESANNSWSDGANNHTEGAEGAWSDRKAAAIQAFNEWLPIRSDIDDEGRIWRSLRFGNLVDLVMLDTRLWARDREAGQFDADAHADPSRTLLGDDQETWFHGELENSTAKWRLVGQQVMMAEWRGAGSAGQPGPIFNADQWDGYAPSRERIFQLLESQAIDNVVVLTGDIHTSWGNDLAMRPFDPENYDRDTGDGSLAVEFVCPGISSPGLGELGELVGPGLQDFNPHVKFVDLQRRGYIVLDITPERCVSEWYHMSTVERPDSEELFIAALGTSDGSNRLQSMDRTDAPSDPPDPAP
ncbi:MAG: alkaline phosphatase D [Bradymonadia bacterium]|jgi:alkaline phosphatase D